jgi:hypothetical protein
MQFTSKNSQKIIIANIHEKKLIEVVLAFYHFLIKSYELDKLAGRDQ